VIDSFPALGRPARLRSCTECTLRYLSGPRTPNGAASICPPGPAMRD